MATSGFGGKILLVDLTKKEIIRLDTDEYAMYGGGHGTSTALFWDFVVKKNPDWNMQDAFDPRNMVSLMTGAVVGTGIPFGARTSVSGMSPQCYPIQWWCHSNFGGTFGTMLKLAGWDGVAAIGKADSPVYINIVDDKVTLEDAKDLWGLTTWKCQEEIWKRSGIRYGQEWVELDGSYTIQRPAIVTMGAAGENLTRVASLVHGGGSGAGQGGFGGVFGSKNLKAVAVVGSRSLKIADPKALVDAKEKYFRGGGGGFGGFGGGGGDVSSCCAGCGMGSRKCHNRNRVFGQDSDDCAESTLFSQTPSNLGNQNQIPPDANRRGMDLCQEYGINGMECCFQGPMSFKTDHNPDFPIQPEVPAYTALGWYMKKMYDMGVIGPGTEYDMAPLNMKQFNTNEFMEIYAKAVAHRHGIGDLLAEGTARFAEKLGRTGDFKTLARLTMWGYQDHWSMPGVEWAYGNLFDSRDINSHDISWGRGDAAEVVNNYAAGTLKNEPLWFDYTWQGDQAYKTGIYSKYKAEWVAWHQHYWNYYKESVGFCDWGYSNLNNGRTPTAEPAFLNAITGRGHSFDDGQEIGRRAWTLKRAIFVLQGRHKNMENFSGYYYEPGASYCGYSTTLPILNGDKWEFQNCRELYFSKEGVNQFKTHFYNVEGWNPDSGYPTRKTLEDLGMKHVADFLESKGKLGAA